MRQKLSNVPKVLNAATESLKNNKQLLIGSAISLLSVISLGLLIPAVIRLNHDTETVHKTPTEENKREFDVSLERVKTIVGGIGTIATIVGGIFLYVNYKQAQEKLEHEKEKAKKDAELAEDKQITERFSKAVEQLGSDKIEVRLGGIYSLERIAKDSLEDHWTIMEVLISFVRERSKNSSEASQTFVAAELAKQKQPKQQRSSVTTDVQAALTVIRRRDATNETEDQRLDLSGTKLSGASLGGINLQGADLRDAQLQGADLRDAQLQGADLRDAQLQGVRLENANLQGARVEKANLQRAVLDGANLQRAKLYGADLQGAKLYGADLQRTVFRNTNLQKAGLDGADLQGATLENANLQGARLGSTNLQRAVLNGANLQRAALQYANLQGALLENADLKRAALQYANLQGALLENADLKRAIFRDTTLNNSILLATDLRNTKSLTPAQLTGNDPPLLCNVALPSTISGIDPNRDCERIPQWLVEHYGKDLLSLETATEWVNEAKQKKWD